MASMTTHQHDGQNNKAQSGRQLLDFYAQGACGHGV